MDALRVVFAEEMEGLKAWFDDRASGRAEHLTMDEAALELRCSVATVRRYVASGRLSVVRLGHGGSGRVLIPRSALADMIASSTA